MTFSQKLISSLETKNSAVCVGLDSRFDRLPNFILKTNRGVTSSAFEFNKLIIDATHEYAAAYKANVSFYAGFGKEGLEALEKTNAYITAQCPEIPVLADCKRSEMGESVGMVKQELFDWLHFDCVMVTPWFGFDTIEKYLEDDTKGVCVYVHDSNPTAPEFQALKLASGQFLYEYVAERVAHHWNKNGNVFAEAGATYPKALASIRRIVGEEMPLLVAGVGAQGGTVNDLVGLSGAGKKRLLVNSSRGIIFAGDVADTQQTYLQKVGVAAMQLRDALLRL